MIHTKRLCETLGSGIAIAVVALAFPAAANMPSAAENAYAGLSSEAKMVVDQVNDNAGGYAAACSGGVSGVSAAVEDAVTNLATSGKIRGDFEQIGNAAGTFYATTCGK